MKKKEVFLVLFIFLIFILYYCLPYILGIFVPNETSYELLEQSVSPNGTYTICAYRVNSGATVDYSVEVYLMTDGQRDTIIFNQYHEREVKIEWYDNSNVSINEIVLDISKGETYDWRRQSED